MNDTIETTKNKLKILKDQGIDTCGVFISYFFYFSVDQTPSCLEFVDWWASNYSPSKGVIMDASRSKILCPVSSLVIRNTLSVSAYFIQMSKEWKEEILVQFFREYSVEKKENFLKSCSKFDSQVLSNHFPIDYNMFNEETQSLLTLASQFLGLDTNKYIT